MAHYLAGRLRAPGAQVEVLAATPLRLWPVQQPCPQWQAADRLLEDMQANSQAVRG